MCCIIECARDHIVDNGRARGEREAVHLKKQCNLFSAIARAHTTYTHIRDIYRYTHIHKRGGELHFIRLRVRWLARGGGAGSAQPPAAGPGPRDPPRPQWPVRPTRTTLHRTPQMTEAFIYDLDLRGTHTHRHTRDTARYSTQHSLSSSSLHLQPQCRPSF